MGGPPAWLLGEGLTTPHREKDSYLQGTEPSGSIKGGEFLD
jgi:hypothetical protein